MALQSAFFFAGEQEQVTAGDKVVLLMSAKITTTLIASKF